MTEFTSLEEIVHIHKLLVDFKQHLKENAERLMTLRNTRRGMGDTQQFECVYGACGYQVESPKLDKLAWREAIMEDPNLFAIQSHFDRAEKLLKEAQEPYMGKPEVRFCIW